TGIAAEGPTDGADHAAAHRGQEPSAALARDAAPLGAHARRVAHRRARRRPARRLIPTSFHRRRGSPSRNAGSCSAPVPPDRGRNASALAPTYRLRVAARTAAIGVLERA